jgi:hypothetical protein
MIFASITLAGFLTAWPVNRWLLKRGIKEAM